MQHRSNQKPREVGDPKDFDLGRKKSLKRRKGEGEQRQDMRVVIGQAGVGYANETSANVRLQ